MNAMEKEVHVSRLLTLIGIAARSAQDSFALAALSRMSAQNASIVPADRMTLARIERGGAIANGQAEAHARATNFQNQANGELRNLLTFSQALAGILSETGADEDQTP